MARADRVECGGAVGTGAGDIGQGGGRRGAGHFAQARGDLGFMPQKQRPAQRVDGGEIGLARGHGMGREGVTAGLQHRVERQARLGEMARGGGPAALRHGFVIGEPRLAQRRQIAADPRRGR